MNLIILGEGAVDSIKGAGGCASNELVGVVFLTIFIFTGAADISATIFINVALEDTQWSVRV